MTDTTEADHEPSSDASPPGADFIGNPTTACVTLHPSLSDIKWDQIELIGATIEKQLTEVASKNVVFDISGLTYMGSAMVALVVRWWKVVDKYGGKSVVALHDPNVFEVIKLASLDEHWTILPTRESAYKKLGVAPLPSSSVSPSSESHGSVAQLESDRGLWVVIVAAMCSAASVLNMILNNQNFDEKFQIGVGCAVVGLVVVLIARVACGGKLKSSATLLGFATLLCGAISIAMVKVPLIGPDTPWGNPPAEASADD